MIKIKNIEVSYGKNKILNNITLDLKQNEFTFILGPNGAGKSTLLKSINGIVKIEAGDILIEDKNICAFEEKDLAKHIAFIPQEFNMQFDFSVYEFVLMTRYPWLNFWGHYTEKDHQIVEKYLSLLDLQDFKNRYFNQLSGGEKQRVLIARALVQETDYILMDESLSFLDINHQIEILQLLKEINNHEDKTIIMVSHNLNLAAEFADRLIFLKKGEMVTSGSPKEVYNPEYLKIVFGMDFCMIENPFTGVLNIVYNG